MKAKIHAINSPIGKVWFYCKDSDFFNELIGLGFRLNGDRAEATVMSGSVAKAEKAGFLVEW